MCLICFNYLHGQIKCLACGRHPIARTKLDHYPTGAWSCVSIEIVQAFLLEMKFTGISWATDSAAFFNLPDFLALCRHRVDEARASGASLFHTVLHLNIAALLCFSERQPVEVHSNAHRAALLTQGRRPSQVTHCSYRRFRFPLTTRPLSALIGCGTEGL